MSRGGARDLGFGEALLAGVVALAIGTLACTDAAPPRPESSAERFVRRQIDPPATPGALAPQLTVAGGDVVATWLEPSSLDGGSGHRLRFSRLTEGSWSSPVTIAEGTEFFANWADVPAVVETGSGDLLAHWLVKTGEETYAYSVFLARSGDGGATWAELGKLNSDATNTEHGFVAWVPEAEGARAFWLDGREMASGGAMWVRTALVSREVGAETVLDERTCECCSIDAAIGSEGPIVVYRDRDQTETRDTAIVRRVNGSWTEPETLHADGWRIEGCPVNGPAVAADGDQVVVAWFTGAGGAPRVRAAFSFDAGVSFEPALDIDRQSPLGRVDVTLESGGAALLTWMRAADQGAEVVLQRVEAGGTDGEPLVLALTSAARASGFPRLTTRDGIAYVAWVDVARDRPQRLRVVELSPVARTTS